MIVSFSDLRLSVKKLRIELQRENKCVILKVRGECNVKEI